MDVEGRWAELMGYPEADLPLDEAALLISASLNPSVDVPAQLERLDQLARRVRPGDVADLCRVMFEELGLTGDRVTYDDPANSFIDSVLDRSRGIPISLSVLLVEVGRRSQIRLEPVGMPAHFVVRDPARPDALIDAFDGGRRLDWDRCARIVRQATGSELTPAMLATTGAPAILARMLANLDRSFEVRDDRASLARVTGLRRMLPGLPVGDRAQLAGRLAALGRFDVAADLLEQIALHLGGETNTERLLRQAGDLRARLN